MADFAVTSLFCLHTAHNWAHSPVHGRFIRAASSCSPPAPGPVQELALSCLFPVTATGCNENEADHLDRDQQPYPPSQKTKRMRTSFKHHQLRTMKSYFAINHNPDAKDLKQRFCVYADLLKILGKK